MADGVGRAADAHDDVVPRVAQAVRRIASAVVRTDREMSELPAIAARIHSLADELEKRAPSAEDRVVQMDRPGRIRRYGPVVGSHNAIAPPLYLRAVDDGLEGAVAFSAAHEVHPGVVHEGVAAMVLDVALADANVRAGVPGMTAQLTVRFHRPIPTSRDLTVKALHDRIDGRKAFAEGEMWDGGDLCVSAEGLFVVARTAAVHEG